MSTVIMAACWPLQMPPTPKAVLVSLADNANDQGVCWPAIPTICERTCLGRTAVINAIKWLEQHCALVVEHGRGVTHPNHYTLRPSNFKFETSASRTDKTSVSRTVHGANGSCGALETSASRTGNVRHADPNRKEPSRTVSISSQPAADDCPAGQVGESKLALTAAVHLADHKAERLHQVTDDAIAAYNARLGKPHGLLPAVTYGVGREKREAQVKRCLRVARQICEQQYGSPTIPSKFWEAYFAEVDQDPFRSGRQSGGKGHENWTPSFEYLTRAEVVLEVFDRAMSKAMSEAAA